MGRTRGRVDMVFLLQRLTQDVQRASLRGTVRRGTLLKFLTWKLETPQPTLLTLMLRPHGLA